MLSDRRKESSDGLIFFKLYKNGENMISKPCGKFCLKSLLQI